MAAFDPGRVEFDAENRVIYAAERGPFECVVGGSRRWAEDGLSARGESP
jgi:hypothetical protein